MIRRVAATVHLGRLVTAGLVTVSEVGRRRLHKLRSPEVVAAIEALMAAMSPASPVMFSREVSAGDRWSRRGVVSPLEAGKSGFVHTWSDSLLAALDVSYLSRRYGSAPEVRGCGRLDRRVVHVVGRLGAPLLTALLDRQRLERRPGDRALAITDKGGHLFAELGISL
jgi:hypothetical protein